MTLLEASQVMGLPTQVAGSVAEAQIQTDRTTLSVQTAADLGAKNVERRLLQLTAMVPMETNHAMLCTECAKSLTPYLIEMLGRAITTTYDLLQLRKDRSGGFSKQGQTYKSSWMEKESRESEFLITCANIVTTQVHHSKD